jgi:hypothetical protein
MHSFSHRFVITEITLFGPADTSQDRHAAALILESVQPLPEDLCGNHGIHAAPVSSKIQ